MITFSLYKLLALATQFWRGMTTEKRRKRDWLDKRMVDGYIRTEISMEIPIDIYQLIYNFYHLLAVILEFDDKFMSSRCITLSQDKTCAIKLDAIGNSGHRYALTNADPVFDGVHCWRVLVEIVS